MFAASRPARRQFLGFLLLTALSTSLFAPPVQGQTTGKPRTPGAEQPQPRKARLPPYYGRVATADQRAALDKIQASYAAKIESLQSELDKLRTQRDAELRAALAPEQQQQLDRLIVAARERRRARAELRLDTPAPKATAEAGNAARISRPAQESTGAKP